MARDIFDIEKKIVAITGGLGRLGREFAWELLERGSRVAIFDQTDSINRSSVEIQSWPHPENLRLFPVDVTVRDSLSAGLAAVIRQWAEPPHALINAAAIDAPPDAPAEENGPFESYPEESWDRVLDVNLKGVFLCCQVVGGAMASAGRGSIVNIGSIYGQVSPDQRIYGYRQAQDAAFYKPVAYSASKSGLLNLTRYLATYWAEKNVRVNLLTFGGVFDGQDAEFLKGYCARVPMGRMARKNEYNGAVVFLISDASGYMTGSNLVIDGGWTAW